MQLPRFFRSIPALAVAVGLLTLTACEKEANTTDTGSDSLAFILDADDEATVDALCFEGETEQMAALREKFGNEERPRFTGDCFQLIYPVTITFPDATEVSVDSAGAIRAAVRAWISANPDRPRPRVRPAFAFPLDVQLADGTVQTIETQAGFRALLLSCRAEPEQCFTLVYPVTYAFGDARMTFASAAELRAAFRRYHRANGDRPQRLRPVLVFPVQAEAANGEIVTLDSPEAMRRLRASCGDVRSNGGRPHGNANCYTFVFPISGTNAAGTTVTVTDAMGLRRMLSHANGRGRFEINFPINVTLANGTVRELANPAALRQLRARCG